jgi:hypothetical protein
LSTPGEDEEENVKKRAKAVSALDGSERDDSPAQETEEVKEVTQGVKDVELEERKPEAVPLPVTPPPEPQIELEAQPEKLEEVTEKAEGAVEKAAEEKVEEKVSTSLEDAALSQKMTPGKPAKKLVATGTPDVSDEAISTKMPRKTRDLPTKAAKSAAKSVKKMVESVERMGKTSGDTMEPRKDGTSV